jgi:hypothetical protein
MRLAALLVGLCVLAGCAKKDGPPGGPTPDATSGFDPRDGVRTGQWLARELDKARAFPKGDEAAGRAAADAYARTLDGLKGKKLAWPAEVAGVLADGRVGIKPLRFKHAADGAERAYLIRLTYTPAASPAAAEEHKNAPQHFPARGKPWVSSLKEGDKVVVSGTVAEVTTSHPLSATEPLVTFDSYQWTLRLDPYDLDLPR